MKIVVGGDEHLLHDFMQQVFVRARQAPVAPVCGGGGNHGERRPLARRVLLVVCVFMLNEFVRASTGWRGGAFCRARYTLVEWKERFASMAAGHVV